MEKKKSIKLVVGTRLVTVDGFEVLAYPTDRQAYGRLCQLLTKGNRKSKKGECHLTFEEILATSEGQMLIALPPLELFSDGTNPTVLNVHRHPEVRAKRASKDDGPGASTRILRGSRCARAPQDEGNFTERLSALARTAPGRTFLAGVHYHRGDEPRRLGLLAELGERLHAPLVAVNDVAYHAPERRPLADILTCVREKCTIAEAGLRLAVNAERHLKPPAEMARLFENFPDAIARTVEIAKACHFSLGELKYEYPDEPVPEGKTAQQHLEDLTWAGAHDRYPKDKYPHGIPDDVAKRLHDELALIAKLDYARYFLTVHDVVAFARRQDKEILCQGRGSAANSAVCYCLGITSVNPEKTKLLFARFISENRGEPPDIDVDFEHERREEVIQYIYRRYGRDRAAICSTVVHYRSRRAIREVGKVLGLTEDVTAALAKTVWGYGDGLLDDHIRQAGLDPSNPAIRQAVASRRRADRLPAPSLAACRRLRADPRAARRDGADRQCRHGRSHLHRVGQGRHRHARPHEGRRARAWHAELPAPRARSPAAALRQEPIRSPRCRRTIAAVYEMLSRADSVGVFQVESRAQMSMLPRLKPQCFYDLVIEVAIVRPGPIQGDMVHPYLRRRDGIEQGALSLARIRRTGRQTN